jgi:hypothetical protein
MSVLTLCTVENIMSIIADDFGNKRPETSPMTAKIIRIRQQLAHGRYDLDERLDAVLERILADIMP